MNAYEQLLADRATPGAGLFLAITRQCPLACDHCSTRSHPRLPPAQHHDGLVAFVRDIGRAARPGPRHVLFTGGEPFLHPQLLVELSTLVHRWGGLVHAITGGFFARAARVPPPIVEAVSHLDSLSVSWDRFHEALISFTDFERTVDTLCTLGPVVSLQVTVDDVDPSLPDRVRARFPALDMFVSPLGANGRARDGGRREAVATSADSPCTVAAWPVVSYTGAILACCNQDAIDEEPARVPRHLLLGELATTGWDEILDRRLASTALRCIETLGPGALSAPAARALDRCTACRALDRDAREVPAPSARLISAVELLRRQWFEQRRRPA